MPSKEEIEQAKTPRGGWTRKQLAQWGVPWPPPKGWKTKLIEEHEKNEHSRPSARWRSLVCR